MVGTVPSIQVSVSSSVRLLAVESPSLDRLDPARVIGGGMFDRRRDRGAGIDVTVGDSGDFGRIGRRSLSSASRSIATRADRSGVNVVVGIGGSSTSRSGREAG